MSAARHAASYRAPAGYVFMQDAVAYRAVQPSYCEAYEHLMSSGLYASLTGKGWMIGHAEAPETAPPAPAWKVLRPDQIPFWTYPYEWCFGQLKDAALRTLEVALEGLKHGMILKDASAYNIQFHNGQPR